MTNKQTERELDPYKDTKLKNGRTVANTSIEAYHETGTKREAYRSNILEYLKANPSKTSREIAKALGIERTTVTGILKPLQNRRKIYISNVVVDSITNRKVRCYSLAVSPEEKAEAKKQLEKMREREQQLAEEKRLRYLDDDQQAA